MRIGKAFSFLLKSITVGLAAAFVIVILRPDLMGNSTVVEVKQSVAPTTTATASSNEVAMANSFSAAVKVAAPAVVNIYTAKLVTERSNPFFDDPFMQRFFGTPGAPRQRVENSLGSGVIVSSQGYVLTNNHVIEGADQIQVALSDGRSADASVVGIDRGTDLAVLKIVLNQLPSIVLGESEQVLVGDIVLAIGNPFAVGQTVTHGIVSATGRDHLGINTFENFIQTDAAINPGNSGGALVDAQGRLIGINTAIFSRTGGSQGIGFAIPVNLAKVVMAQIIEYGRAIRGWLGIEAQTITSALAESLGLAQTEGVIVARVLPNGPADQAGIQPGDIITAIGDENIDEPITLMNAVAQTAPGSTIQIQGLRQGESFNLDATVGERPPPPPVQ